MTDVVFFCYYGNDALPKIIAQDYEKLTQETKREFEMMSLAGGFLNEDDINHENYPEFCSILKKHKQIAIDHGIIYTHENTPRELWNGLSQSNKLHLIDQDSIDCHAKYCILLAGSQFTSYPQVNIRVFWGKKVEGETKEYFKILNHSCSEIKKILHDCFDISNPTLSNSNYGFVVINENILKQCQKKLPVIKLNDGDLQFFFHI